MKAKLSIAFALSLVLVLLIAGSAAAVKVVTYTDMGAEAVGDYVDDYWFAPGEAGGPFIVENGDFSLWEGGFPVGWDVWDDGAKSGWEEAHLAMIDLALGGSGENYAMGLFVRNVGGKGSYYAGAAQQLANVTESGYYWVNAHASMFGEYDFFEIYNYIFFSADHLANAFAWYAISPEAEASHVEGWRELFPVGALPGAIPCPNPWEGCIYAGRYETVWIDAGDYFHLKAGHKFPTYNVWTTFVFDDISIVPAEGDVIEDGFWADGAVYWDENAPR
jgi:hypothetical protein